MQGHSESGNVLEDKENNDGTFRALLRFRVDAGDKYLESHIHTGQKNAQYMSATIQNEIINIRGDVIKDTIVDRVNRSLAFSVLCDETTDISIANGADFIVSPLYRSGRDNFERGIYRICPSTRPYR